MRIPTNDQLTKAAEKTYGTQCSQSFCKAGVGYRLLSYDDASLKPERAPDDDGTWITVRVFVADDAIDEVL